VLLAVDGASYVLFSSSSPIPSGTWYHYPLNVPTYTSSTTTLGLIFAPNASWSGTIYLDNFYLQ
jgi:hypothetical protein